MKMNINTPAPIDCPLQQLRMKVAYARTTLIESDIFDKVTGEHYGSYIKAPLSLEGPLDRPGGLTHLQKGWCVAEDGSPAPPENHPPTPEHLAPVIKLFPNQLIQQAEKKPKVGRKPQVIDNPLANALCTLNIEERPTPWLDDFAFGAVCTGPGLINGKHSVSLADVKKLLRLPELSVSVAAEFILNHDRQPMSTRQLQRVVEAARTALRGVALHLERHPEILRSIDATIDFDKFWASDDAQTKPANKKQLSKKQQALEMRRAGVPIKTTAKKLGISRNTVKKWDDEAQAQERGQ